MNYPEQFCKYYLESKNIAIVNEVPQSAISTEDLQRAINITIKTSGLNPIRLAPYRNLMVNIEAVLQRTSSIKNIEATYMKRLVNCLGSKTGSISEFVEELIKSTNAADVQLARRILSLLSEVEECTICMSSSTSDTFFQCGHRVCSDCSKSLSTCPFCRAEITTRLQEIEQKEKEAPPTSKPHVPKFRMVDDLPIWIKTRFLGLLKRSSTLDSTTCKELSTLIEYFTTEMFEVYKENSSKVRTEEAITYLNGKFFFFIVLGGKLNHINWTESQTSTAEFLGKPIRTPSRLIRFLSTISPLDEAIKDKPIKLKFSNKFRVFIVGLIDKFELIPAETEMNQRKGFWVWLFKKLHIRESKWNKYTTARSLAEFARNTRKASSKSFMHDFNQLYCNKDVKILAFFEERPGLCFRFFRCSLSKLQDIIKKEEWVAFLQRIIPKFKQVHLVELLHILESIPSLAGSLPVTYRIKNGQFYWSDSFVVPDYNTEFVNSAIEIVKKQIKVNYRLIVDTTYPLDNLRLNRGRPPRVPDWVPQVSATGDIISIDPNQQVVIFVHWMNGQTRVDLDLSVMLLGANGKKVGKVDFCCLSSYTVQHSGDYTDAPPPNGCSEYITFCPANVVKANSRIEELYVLCFSFNGVAFDNMGQAFVGIGVKDEASKGLGPDGCKVICGCELKGENEVNFTSKFNFKTNQFTFVNTNVTAKRGVYSIGSSSRQLAEVARRFDGWLGSRAPGTFQEVVDSLYYGAKEVKLLNNGKDKLYKKREDETGVAFRDRVKKNVDDDKYVEDPSTKVVYFGDGETLTDDVTKQWASDSLIISKTDPHCPSNVIWTTDPYSVFN